MAKVLKPVNAGKNPGLAKLPKPVRNKMGYQKDGGKSALGMKSVKAGYDKNPGVTRADIIVAAKKEAKGGAKLKKQAAVAIAMKAAGKKPKKARGGATLSPSKSSTSNRLASYGRPLGKNLSGKLKSGGKVKKAMGGYKTMKGGGKMDKCRGGCY